jgi:hypothetical protein
MPKKKKKMKKCSPSLTIKKMQIKSKLRFYLISIRMGTIKKTNNNKCWQGYRKKSNPHTMLMEIQISTTTMENTMEAPQKTKNRTAI